MPMPAMLRRFCVVLLSFAVALPASERPPGAAIATAHPMATEAAREIFEQGGNAFDAAVAATASLAVVEPYGSGIGGGGFWLLHRAADGHQVMVDGRETAPGEAHAEMYLDADGEPVSGASLNGPLAAGIPGTPAALAHITEHYGQLTLSQNLAPAIRQARHGFPVDRHYQRLMGFRKDAVREWPDAAAIFLLDGETPRKGHLIRQPDLARTLERIAEKGHDGFYQGELAAQLVQATRDAGGIWQLDDLADYRIVEREPVVIDYRDMRITAAGLPSAGGVALGTMFGLLADFELDQLDRVSRIHLIAETMRRAYRDRSLFLGDPDFIEDPTVHLLGEAHLSLLASDLELERATDSGDLPTPRQRGEDTTHFSIIDDDGNRVAATLSINYPFGSGFVAAGTGVLLNNEMDDFATRPGEPNAYGLIGGEPNLIEPGKRPLSSMTPAFVETDERIGVLGSPGGSRIITQVMLGILAFADGKAVHSWVSQPRYHHQYTPDRIEHEPSAFDQHTIRGLEALGHSVESAGRQFGDMQALLWHRGDDRLEAASDPRGGGKAIVLPRQQH
ncbi:gamma-glutamyltransferase [Methylonatrum kenyense]|uniref:gamma-glutamyltransferase n=1 Tax=Methylonatrum kenyense TaxID=455253 RepID=UPI0020BF536C|nr:gamma-glutamyltransferase [Methylonatrum kenyense]MCK8515490.1 gamma-glutamyltransferase [Methylonatrum kenyense]